MSVRDAMNFMFEKHIRHLVIQEDGGLIGVRDVLAALLEEDEGKLKDLENQSKLSAVF